MTTEQEAIMYANIINIMHEWNLENHQYIGKLIGMENLEAYDYVKRKSINLDDHSLNKGNGAEIKRITTELLGAYAKFCDKNNLDLSTHTLALIKTLGTEPYPKYHLEGNDVKSLTKSIKERVDKYSDLVNYYINELKTSAPTSDFVQILNDLENTQYHLELFAITLAYKLEKTTDEGRV